MLLTFATLAVLAFCISVEVVGLALLRRGRGWRIIGGALLAQGLLATTALTVLSTLPFGIGEPLIRVPFRDILVQTLGSLAVIGGVAGLVYLIAHWVRTRLPRERAPGGKRAAGRWVATASYASARSPGRGWPSRCSAACHAPPAPPGSARPGNARPSARGWGGA